MKCKKNLSILFALTEFLCKLNYKLQLISIKICLFFFLNWKMKKFIRNFMINPWSTQYILYYLCRNLSFRCQKLCSILPKNKSRLFNILSKILK